MDIALEATDRVFSRTAAAAGAIEPT